MNHCADYTEFRDAQWRVWTYRASWQRSVWPRLRQVIEEQMSRGRPQIHRLALAGEGKSTRMLLKVYPPAGRIGQLKDLFRASKALRYWRQTLSLGSCGFLTPRVWAVGECRVWRRLEMAFVVMEVIPGESLSTHLWRDVANGRPQLIAHEKWARIRELGEQVGRMHSLGFVHGDLVPSNILLRREGDRTLYYYIDHDRTRRYPGWLPQTLWKRNLIQLNRFVLPNVSLPDRLRFFHAYLEGRQKQYGPDERRLLRWLARRTAARRKETRMPGRECRRPKPREYAELKIGE